MKILMILEANFPPDVRVEKEINTLINAGYEITLLSASPNAENSIFYWNKAKIIKHKMPRLIYKSSVAALKSNIYFNYWHKLISQTMKNEQFSAIHLHDLPLAKVAAKFSKIYNIPFVLDLHENWADYMGIATHTNTFLGKILSSPAQWHRYEQEMCMKADRIISVVKEMKERIIQLGVDENKIIVLPNSISLTDQIDYIPSERFSDFSLFYGGGINIHRGLQIVLKAIKIVSEKIPNIKLNIVGDGSYKNILENYVIENNLAKNIVFWGWKKYDEMVDILIKSDVALIPHLRSVQTDNSSPNKLYQYAYFQIPIIASDCISIKRILAEMNCGITYFHNDPNDLAEKILELAENQEKLQQLAKNGFEAIQNKFNWEIDSLELIQMYKNLLRDENESFIN